MKSREQKVLTGTLAPSRDKAKGLVFPGAPVVDITPPKHLPKEIQAQWKTTVGPLSKLELLREQDMVELVLAHEILAEVKKIRDAKKATEKKDWLGKDFDTWTRLCNIEMRLIDRYVSIMRGYFVSPKERVKAIEKIAAAGADLSKVKKDSIDEFIGG